ncbi:T9SS type A sorting domain-containing protein [Flavobacterium phycosphaerae]|uniref:T9SS type A sorting domain-containing protein n=1 Tax=Flavobacterium phycosphaerae TaxID=2697515 RepID=UPI00138997F3|nr:T9SS type A sorting domain-containing protein [Flavobacterium phycosphaerae]
MKKLLLSLSLFSVGLVTHSQSWVSQATGFTAESRGVSEIHVVDANTVWAMAFDGAPITTAHPAALNIQEFTLTTDGGSSWTPGIIDVGDTTYELNNISPVSGTTAWVSAINNTTDDPNIGVGVVCKTSDAGLTWEAQNTSGFQTAGESFLNGVHFFDANNGIAYGDPLGGEFEIYRTTDGGDNWTQVPAASLPDPISGEYGYNSIPTVAGNTLWFTTNKGKMYRTTNMGVNWTKLNGPTGFTDFGATAINGRLLFSDNNNGIIMGTTNGSATTPTYKIWKTTDGGATWSAPITYTGYRLLTYVPGTSILVACGAGTSSGGVGSAYSTDNGTTWTTIDTNIEQRLTPAFFNSTTGWCGGFSTDSITDGIFQFSGNLGTEQFAANTIKLYPNPATSVVNIAAQLDSYNVKVTDMTGKVMLNKAFSGVENTVDISSFATGVYFFEIKSGNKSETTKIMKN